MHDKNQNTQSLVTTGKTLSHIDTRVEWLIWQLALALEEALEELNELKQQDK